MTLKRAQQILQQHANYSSLARVGAGIGEHRDGGKPYRHNQVRAWILGEKVPSDHARKAIAKWSGGAIPESVWKR